MSEVWVKGNGICGEGGEGGHTTVEIQGLTQRVTVTVPNSSVQDANRPHRPERNGRKVLEETIDGCRKVVASNQNGRTATEALAIMRDCGSQLAAMEREGR